MGLRPTHGDESSLLRFIDFKRVTPDFRRSAMATLVRRDKTGMKRRMQDSHKKGVATHLAPSLALLP